MHQRIHNRTALIDWGNSRLRGENVKEKVVTVGDLRGIFGSPTSANSATVVYRVQWIEGVPDGTEGGLFWGNTIIEPGRIGDEYFMTHGHLHAKSDRGEFYATLSGQGALILMNAAGHTWTEPMKPGSLHYIGGNVAHRVANVGDTPLAFVACWPSDAGHDYGTIREQGFSARLLCRDGAPTLVRSQSTC